MMGETVTTAWTVTDTILESLSTVIASSLFHPRSPDFLALKVAGCRRRTQGRRSQPHFRVPTAGYAVGSPGPAEGMEMSGQAVTLPRTARTIDLAVGERSSGRILRDFDEDERPKILRLHLVRDELLAV